MKILCFVVIGIAFLIFYQQNPTVCLILVAVVLGGYVFFKLRKRGSNKGGIKAFFTGRNENTEANTEKILTFLLLDKYLSNTDLDIQGTQNTPDPKIQYIEDQKQKIIKLLRE